MTAEEYIRKVNFMINAGTDFDYEAEYKKLSFEDQMIVSAHFENIKFVATT